MIHALYPLTRPLVRRLEPEFARTWSLRLLKLTAPLAWQEADDQRLRVSAFGMDFPNPIGLAAGFDKNAEVVDAAWSMGPGFIEIGTVTPKPQTGNPAPRVFRLEDDKAVINRFGFNSDGIDAVRERLKNRKKRHGIIGVNIGANKETQDRINDYLVGLNELAPLASYVSINISSPNTPGLRGLQDKTELDALLSALCNARAKLPHYVPLLVKIAPDLDDHACSDIAELTIAHRIEGLIVSNTTVARPSGLTSHYASEVGGLSGAPLFARSTAVLRTMRRLTQGRVTLIGVGGVSSGADAYTKIKAGASLVQLYTALTYEGPALISRMKRDLLALLTQDGHTSIGAAVGTDAS